MTLLLRQTRGQNADGYIVCRLSMNRDRDPTKNTNTYTDTGLHYACFCNLYTLTSQYKDDLTFIKYIYIIKFNSHAPFN